VTVVAKDTNWQIKDQYPHEGETFEIQYTVSSGSNVECGPAEGHALRAAAHQKVSGSADVDPTVHADRTA
jgi:hypothetical protein